MTPLPIAVCVGRCGGRNQVKTLFLNVLAIYVIHLDTGNFVKLVYWFLPNRHCPVLSPARLPLRLKSSASSATGTSSSFMAPWSRLPTMGSLSVRLFPCFFKSASLSASSWRWFGVVRPHSQFVLAVNGAAVSMGAFVNVRGFRKETHWCCSCVCGQEE